ncbi:MAG: phytanoyl-CoA dioxygenase family protein [bacterium]|nr:phytanoyl-CoA dioxygenase family protein [bacterium]
MSERRLDFEREGWVSVPSLIATEELQELRVAVGAPVPSQGRGGIRSLMKRFPAVRSLAVDSRFRDLASELLGATARPVKATLFDKTPGANWKLPFHQDTVIAVRRKVDVSGFGPWSIKDGIQHVRAPASVLSRMVALRLHLDDTPIANGALRVVPGSHRRGRLSASETRTLRQEIGEVTCSARAGDVLAMSPLLLHASSASERPTHRRVIHIEYSAAELPAPLEWAA